jgi:allophanate hydrolase subunit 1
VHLIPIGPDAVLAELSPADGASAAASLAAWARDRIEAREIVPAATTVLFDGLADGDLAGALAGWRPTAHEPGPELEVEVTFDGPDLAAVASAAGLTADAVVDLVAATEFTVAFCGFAPGFAYLAGLPAILNLPRRATPRTRVEAGAVAIAGEYAGIYPTASPGGWHLIGRSDAVLWDRPGPSRPCCRPEPG